LKVEKNSNASTGSISSTSTRNLSTKSDFERTIDQNQSAQQSSIAANAFWCSKNLSGNKMIELYTNRLAEIE